MRKEKLFILQNSNDLRPLQSDLTIKKKIKTQITARKNA